MVDLNNLLGKSVQQLLTSNKYVKLITVDGIWTLSSPEVEIEDPVGSLDAGGPITGAGKTEDNLYTIATENSTITFQANGELNLTEGDSNE